VRFAFLVVLLWLAFATNLICERVARAQGFSPDDTVAAIDAASAETGVSWSWLYRVVRCETGGTLNPYAVGRQGERGVAQLHPYGMLPTFYALGYADPFDPYEAVRFMAYRFAEGRARAWSCR
jgi:soluble lytic murein transglycosylase-like protein